MSRGRVAIIGGTGLDTLPGLELTESRLVSTPFGEPASPLALGTFAGHPVCFLPRHGTAHAVPPHRINYRANVWALRCAGVQEIIACAAVGGIGPGLETGKIVVPDNLIDYTWGRESTFHEPPDVTHVDFTYPYSGPLREALLRAGEEVGIAVVDGGVYGATQGPRLETAAEIDRMERDGCTIVGMTGMPEAVLAREAGLEYATCALVVNAAAGRAVGVITMDEIARALDSGMVQVRELLGGALTRLARRE